VAGEYRQVWLTALVDKRCVAGKLCDQSSTHATPEHLITLSVVHDAIYKFTITLRVHDSGKTSSAMPNALHAVRNQFNRRQTKRVGRAIIDMGQGGEEGRVLAPRPTAGVRPRQVNV